MIISNEDLQPYYAKAEDEVACQERIAL